jgi:hypothetical protein
MVRGYLVFALLAQTCVTRHHDGGYVDVAHPDAVVLLDL